MIIIVLYMMIILHAYEFTMIVLMRRNLPVCILESGMSIWASWNSYDLVLVTIPIQNMQDKLKQRKNIHV